MRCPRFWRQRFIVHTASLSVATQPKPSRADVAVSASCVHVRSSRAVSFCTVVSADNFCSPTPAYPEFMNLSPMLRKDYTNPPRCIPINFTLSSFLRLPLSLSLCHRASAFGPSVSRQEQRPLLSGFFHGVPVSLRFQSTFSERVLDRLAKQLTYYVTRTATLTTWIE